MRSWPLPLAAALLLACVGLPAEAQGEGGAHAPILIQGDSWLGTAGSGVVRGSGMDGDPFVIEGWAIDVRGQPDTPGIHIRDTSAHLLVKDCLVLKDKAGTGIHVQAAKNVRIEGCRVHTPSPSSTDQETTSSPTSDSPNGTEQGSTEPSPEASEPSASEAPSDSAEASTSTPAAEAAGEAILVEEAEAIVVENSSILHEAGAAGDGVLLRVVDTAGVVLAGNQVAGSPGDGIRVEGGSGVTIAGNTVIASGGSGIVVAGAPPEPEGTTDGSGSPDGPTAPAEGGDAAGDGRPDVLVQGNTVTGNQDDGIRVEGGREAVVQGNEATSNGGDGIEVAGAREATVADNTASGNEGVGVAVASGAGTIAGNTVSDNGGGGIVVEGPATVTRNTLVANAEYAVAVVSDDPETVVEGNQASGDEAATTILVPPGPRVGDNGATVVLAAAGFDPRNLGDGGAGEMPAPPKDTGWFWMLLGIGAVLAAAFILRRPR